MQKEKIIVAALEKVEKSLKEVEKVRLHGITSHMAGFNRSSWPTFTS